MKILTAMLAIFILKPSFSKVKHQQWLAYTLPPYFMSEDSAFYGEGIGDVMFRQWTRLFPDLSHQKVAVTIPRLKKFVVEGRNRFCVVGSFISEEDKKHYIWTTPVFYEPPPMIVLSQEAYKKVNSPEKAIIKDLLKNKDLIFGHIKGRFYSGELDLTIATAKEEKNFVDVSGKMPTQSLVKMILAKRVQWGIVFHTELEWLFKNNLIDAKPEDLISLPIANHDVSLGVHVGCSKRANGRRIIKKIQAELDKKKILAPIRKAYKSWLFNEASVKQFDSYNQF